MSTLLGEDFGSEAMRPSEAVPKNIDDYIAGFPPDVQVILEKVRATIREAAPAAHETIKYQMPTFTLEGNLVHFAACKSHIGLYPAPTGNEELQRNLSAYRGAKASVRFPLDEPIPFELIGEIVKARVKENAQRAQAGGKYWRTPECGEDQPFNEILRKALHTVRDLGRLFSFPAHSRSIQHSDSDFGWHIEANRGLAHLDPRRAGHGLSERALLPRSFGSQAFSRDVPGNGRSVGIESALTL